MRGNLRNHNKASSGVFETRVKAFAIFLFLASIIILGRLFYWQVANSSEFSSQARFQREIGRTIPATRGSILSSDSSYLTASQERYLVYAFLPQLKDANAAAKALSPLLSIDENYLLGLMQKTSVRWIALAHKVDKQIRDQIEKLSLTGIGFENEEARVYPEASMSAHLLGFVGKSDNGEDKGYFGLEGYYDLTISGKSGFLNREQDAQGAPIVFGNSREINAQKGVDLTTFIDKRIQLLVEQKLAEGINKYGAKAGSITIMDPKTGGILAMASYPYYDPGKYFEASNELFRNPIISDAFEPGSIFKPIIMASAIDDKAITPDTRCDVCDRPYKVDKYFIETWDKKYHPNSTMTEVLLHSDNVGMTFVGNRLGSDKLYDYLEKFGFGRVTGIDLQGEVSPSLLAKKSWSEVDLATASFGQGIAVTPIQILKAVAIIANQGKDVAPRVVKKISLDDWQEELTNTANAKEVISASAASEITKMMVEAVKSGEAKWAVPKGFSIAGKTGTAQIPVSGHYDPEKTNASFVGFAPSYNPRFVMLVSLREPQSSQWASETAAPLWFSIASQILPYLGISPEN